MGRPAALRARILAFLPWLALVAACAGPQPLPAPAATEAPLAPAPVAVNVAAPEAGPPSSELLPIYAEDAAFGPAEAPVTLVWFTDLQCPFCARVRATLSSLRAHYANDLRAVVKHNPLPFHPQAFSAAVIGLAVRKRGGDDAFFRYVDLVYERQKDLKDDSILFALAAEAGVDARGALEDATYQTQVRRDMELARKLGAMGTPAFRINGITLSGAQPEERFRELIDQELAAVRALGPGVGRSQVYALRVQKNLELAPTPPEAAPDKPDTTVWAVPVGSSPTLGPADALVTLIEFGDYQCPFTQRVGATVDQLRRDYPKDLRLVFKHNPLPFHPRAAPAARLAVEVQKALGDDAFWKVHAALFESQRHLEDEDLVRIGVGVGLSRARALTALRRAEDPTVAADQQLAEDFDARGTPHFFVNGVRLSGAQPLEKFKELIDRQLTEARTRVRAGTPAARVYAEIVKTARSPEEPETKPVPKLGGREPVLGAPRAAVTLFLFSDLECRFSKKLFPELLELEARNRGQLRIVWLDLPLPFHKQARRAANAAHEVKKQKGDAAFWRFVGLLLEHQAELADDSRIRALAREVGADGEQVLQAMAADRHARAIDDSGRVAAALDINATPTSLINGYLVTGAQAQSKFTSAIRRAAKDVKAGRRPRTLELPPATAGVRAPAN